ncbi:hypothetical protein PybrP1_011983 [[Pythium] brassicae (nom. inval.)]|nr:hypothetical protein PybrP1_011983 [[Pythium] brassicae (nom. inval.)]
MPHHLRHSTGTFRNVRGQNLSYVALFPPVSDSATTSDSSAAAPLSSPSLSSPSRGCSDSNSSSNASTSAANRHAAWRPVLRLSALVVRPMSVLLPKVRAVPAVKYELLCRDPAFLEDFDNDPLTITDKMTLRMGAQSLKAFGALRKDTRFADPSSALCALPVLFMMGSADKVTSLPLAVEYFEKMGSKDKLFKVFEGMFHTLFDDPEKDEVFGYMTEWLTSRFPTAAERQQAQQQQRTRRQYDLVGDGDESWNTTSSGSHSSSSHRRRAGIKLI